MAKIKQARAKIVEALAKATFATAGFGNIVDRQTGGPDVDHICKAETRLYRESWLIPPLIQALKLIDPCPKCGGNGHRYQGAEWSANRIECEPCKGSGIAGGLPFDPYQLSQEAAAGKMTLRDQQELANRLEGAR